MPLDSIPHTASCCRALSINPMLQCDSLSCDSLCPDSLCCDSAHLALLGSEALPEVPAPLLGSVVGIERAQSIGETDGVGLLLIVCFLLLTGIVSRSWKYLQRASQDFFYPTDHNNIYDDSTPDNRLHGGLALLLLVGISIGLLCYALMPAIALWVWLAAAIGCEAGKVGIYAFVNTTFFTPTQRFTWRGGYRLLILLQSVLLSLIACAAIYFGVQQQWVVIAAVLAVGVVKILLLYKTIATFFPGNSQLLHLILYFCTLEIAPIAALLAIVNHIL